MKPRAFYLICVAWSIVFALGAFNGLIYTATVQANKLFIPMVYYPDPFALDAPIWSGDVYAAIPSLPEVVLFRHNFSLSHHASDAELHIFADTRYEVWMDGVWVGRGPARFLHNLREYDIYPLATLQPGAHLVAVLVQWAPNNRRSESVSPLLIAHVQGDLGAGAVVLTSTSNFWQWKCLQSDAWRSDAAPVDTRGLIGPTELLDLRRLPADWMLPGYSAEAEAGWAPAVVSSAGGAEAWFLHPAAGLFSPAWSAIPGEAGIRQGAAHGAFQGGNLGDGPGALDTAPTGSGFASLTYSTPQYTARSIDLLVNEPLSATLMDAGLLSPGFAIANLATAPSGAYAMRFRASQPTDLHLELLSAAIPPPGFMQVDGQKLAWHPAGENRPDVLLASLPVNAGAHTLSLDGLPADGVTFSLSRQNLSFSAWPFEQGNHAGRRLLLAETVSDPSQVGVTLTPLSLEFSTLPAYAVLDLGRAMHGRLQAEVSGPPGSILDVGWDERLWTDAHRPLPFPGSLYPQWNEVDSWILDGSQRAISTIDARSGRYVMIAAWGDSPMRVENIRILEERYPVAQVGSFHSSDPLLDRIWQVGVDTLTPNMTDAYTDTPWRERGYWLGDAYIEYRVNQVAFGDVSLIRRGIRQVAAAMAIDSAPGRVPNNDGLHMLDYSMLWVHTLADYLQDTHDAGLAIEVFSALQRFMDHLASYENPLTGLLDLPQVNWGGIGYIDSLGYYSRYGQSTAFNALYYATLLRAAEVADLAGDSMTADAWRARSVVIKENINQYLFLPEQKRYVTNIYAAEAFSPTLHAQAWPLAYGITPLSGPVADSLLEMIAPDPAEPNVGTYGTYWVLQGLGEAGYISQALDVIRLYYGYMLDAGATTWWENFDANLYPRNSYSHGWAASPTWFLTNYVLGARSIGPDAWLVKPAFESLDSAAGDLPLRDGLLRVSWQRSGCQSMRGAADQDSSRAIRLSLTAPPGTHGEVVIPSNSVNLTLDGLEISIGGADWAGKILPQPDGIHVLLGGGAHQIELLQECVPAN